MRMIKQIEDGILKKCHPQFVLEYSLSDPYSSFNDLTGLTVAA